MSVDAKVRLRGYISPEEICYYIKKKYNTDVENTVEIHDYGLITPEMRHGDNIIKRGITHHISQHGFINFKICGQNGEEENRQLFYIYDNIISLSDLEYYISEGLENMVRSETTYLMLGYWGNAVAILKDMAMEYGGWLDENDCDDKPYYYIRKRRK